jgi:type I restriction enzyme R subunit
MSQFSFLQPTFPQVFDLAAKAETQALADPRGACFYARLALETAVEWLYQHDASLRSPYETSRSACIHEPTFRKLVGDALVTKAKIVKDLGNRAVHDANRAVTKDAAATALRELFHVTYWLARTYSRNAKPPAALQFDAGRLEASVTVTASTVQQIQKLRDDHDKHLDALEKEREARLQNEEGRVALEVEIKALQAEIAAIKTANQATPDTHDYNEAATRDAFIDLLLHEAGWPLDQPHDREFPVTGMPNGTGEDFADYVLWGDDAKPLAVIEAKRTKKDARNGQQQVKLYADCLEAQFGQRPVIYYTNGYEHWLWDDAFYPPRPVQGFLKKDELELLHQRRLTRKPLASIAVDTKIADRAYQARAIRRVGEVFEKDHQRKALLVMATGSGKTRTVIALVDQLMRANWVKRVLFLADRRALVRQAHSAFKTQLPSAPSANLLEGARPTEEQPQRRPCAAVDLSHNDEPDQRD